MPTARPSVARDQASKEAFEFRLEGGKSFGFGPPRPGDAGVAHVLAAPDICRSGALARYFDGRARAQWSILPIDATARRTFVDASRIADVVDIGAMTKGVAFVEVSGGYACAFVEVWLPMTDCLRTGLSTFEDWLRILATAKDDLNREALLRLTFDRLQERDIEALGAGQRLSTTDVALEVRPRAIQWARDDD